MPDALETEAFLAELAHDLEKISVAADVREDMLREISDLIADGASIESLGSPDALAHSLKAASSADTAENPHLPIDFSGLFNPSARTRAWDPENPHILVPRSFGAGWDLNMGALAVKLGILNPDDIDDDVLAAIPPSTMRGVRFLPAVLAAASTACYCAAHHTGKRLIKKATIGGKVTGYWGPAAAAFAHVIIPAGVATWAGISRGNRRDDMNRSALASLVLTAIFGAAATSLTVKDDRANPWVYALTAHAAPFAAELAAVAVPIRIGKNQVASYGSQEHPHA